MKKIYVICSLLVLTLVIASCNNTLPEPKCNSGLSWCELKDRCINETRENCLGIVADPDSNCVKTGENSFTCKVNETTVKINELPGK